jgi:glucosamine-6-phosphate deaminase
VEVLIVDDAEAAGRIGADRIASAVARKPPATIGVATGSSPLGVYASLAARSHSGSLDLSRVEWFALDEYVGLPVGHPESYAAVVERTVTAPLGLDPRRVHVPDGAAGDLEAECESYDAALASRGVDIQILGIGSNGHIGFNEPGSSFASRTRVKRLAQQTRADNARFFPTQDDVPTHCITQGLGTIMDADHLLLVALGEQKAEAIAAAVEGPATSMVPASVLQFHRRATVILDEAAASRLRLVDYYRGALV